MRSPDTGRGAQGDESDWRGSKRGNATHISKSDANARLHRKGRATSQLCFMGHTLMENRHGLIVDALVTPVTGRAEREAAKVMIGKVAQKRPRANVTLGADKGYDAAEFVKHLQQINVQPHVAQSKKGRKSVVSDPIAQSEGCRQSMHCRKRIEQGFGWVKSVGQIRQVMVRGIRKVQPAFMLNMAVWNLTRMRSLARLQERTQAQARLQGA